MWKLLLAFVAFAALALFVLSKGGDIDMGGEKHGADALHAPAAASAAAPAASAASAAVPASAASN
jgi:hypothetical protein